MQCSDILYANKTSLQKKEWGMRVVQHHVAVGYTPPVCLSVAHTTTPPFPLTKAQIHWRYTLQEDLIRYRSRRDAHTLLHWVNRQGMTWALSWRPVGHRGEAEVKRCRIWVVIAKLGAGWVIDSLPAIPQEVTESTEEDKTAEQESAATPLEHTHAKLKRVLQLYLLTGSNFSESYKHCLKQLYGTVTQCGPPPARRGTEVQSSCLEVQNYTHFIVHLMLQWRSHPWLNRKPKQKKFKKPSHIPWKQHI